MRCKGTLFSSPHKIFFVFLLRISDNSDYLCPTKVVSGVCPTFLWPQTSSYEEIAQPLRFADFVFGHGDAVGGHPQPFVRPQRLFGVVCGAYAFGTDVVCGLLETTQQILSFEVSHSFNFLEFRSSGVAGVQTIVRIHLVRFNGC